jgi:hypothetical protein
MEATVENIGVAVVENPFAKNSSRQFRQAMLSISGDQLQTPRVAKARLQMASVGKPPISRQNVQKLNAVPRPVRFKSAEGTMPGRRPYLAKVGSSRGFLDHFVVISKHWQDARRERNLSPVGAR